MLFANAYHPVAGPTLRRFRGLGVAGRLYARIRWLLAPVGEVVEQLPETGLCVDIGCGAGLVCHAAAVARPELEVLGIDVDPRRIEMAQRAGAGAENPAFRVGDWYEEVEEAVDAFVFVDVLHHLAEEEQERILGFCASRLRPGGRILIKDVGLRPRWKYAYNVLFDRLTGLLDVTRGVRCTYRAANDWMGLGRDLGLLGRQVNLCHEDFAAHYLVVLEAPEPASERG